jgi:GT2 family glycosyltransferase
MKDNTNELFPKVFAITLNWNGKDDTIECVASLQGLNYPNYEIVVVDNGSTDGSVPVLRAQYPDITIIENGKNLGYAEGFNAGMRYALQQGADYFLIVNNDTVIDPDALGELVGVAEEDPRVGFVSGKVYFYDEPNRLQTAGRLSHPVFIAGALLGYEELDQGQYDEVRECDFIDDVFLLVRRAVFEQVGGYDPTFFLMYEETDWCARVRRSRFKIMYTPDAKIWHKGNQGDTTGRSATHQFYLARNQVPFVRRNASPQHFHRFLRALLFSHAPRQIWRFLKRGHFRLLIAYLRGIVSGMSWLWTQGS